MGDVSKMQEENIGATFDKLILSNATVTNKVFDNCKFNKCNFNAVKFSRCRFIDCEFIHCDLSLADISGSLFMEVVFDESRLLGINWTKANWPHITLVSTIKFYRSDLSHSSFFELSLKELVIEECKAHEVDFRGTDLSNANLAYTDFTKSLFMGTKLIKADFTESTNYSIDINANDIKQAKFSFPDVLALLDCLDIKIIGVD